MRNRITLLCCWAILCGSSNAKPDEMTIIPGRQLGRTEIGMSRDDVHHLLGKPNFVLSSKPGKFSGGSGAMVPDLCVERWETGGRLPDRSFPHRSDHDADWEVRNVRAEYRGKVDAYGRRLGRAVTRKINFVTVIYANDRVIQIEASSSAFHTADGRSTKTASIELTRKSLGVRYPSGHNIVVDNLFVDNGPEDEFALWYADDVSHGITWSY